MVGWEVQFAEPAKEWAGLQNGHFACLFGNFIEPVSITLMHFANCIIRDIDWEGKIIEVRIGGADMLVLGPGTVRAGMFLVSNERGEGVEAIPGKDFPLVQTLESGGTGQLIKVRWV